MATLTYQAHLRKESHNGVDTYVFFPPPIFCQRIAPFWTQNLGKNPAILG